MSKEYEITSPVLYRNRYLIFKSCIFQYMENTDCNDTPMGICSDNKFRNVHDAIDSLDSSSSSFLDNVVGAGYYIKKPWGQGSVFVPIRTGIHPFLNPIYRLRNKSIYNFLSDCDTWAFLDTSLYNFPPEAVSLMYYQDHFSIQDVKTGLFLDSDLLNFKKKDEAGVVCIIPFRDTMYVDQKYIPIRKNTAVSFNIPESSLILGMDADKANKVKWKMNLDFADRDPVKIYKRDDTDPFFVLDNIDKLKRVKAETEGKITLDFADEFYIKLSDKYIFENVRGEMVLTTDSYEECKERNVHFKFIPHVRVYYCDGGGGIANTSLEFAQLEHDGKAFYKGNKLYRNPGCWGLCKRRSRVMEIFLCIVVILWLALYGRTAYRKTSPSSSR
jgi:hypothetical protein